MFDIDHNGIISRDEILAALSSMGEVCVEMVITHNAKEK